MCTAGYVRKGTVPEKVAMFSMKYPYIIKEQAFVGGAYSCHA